MPKILKTPEGKKFLIAVVIVFIIATSVVSTVTFKGVEDQYNLPMEHWSVTLYIMQGAWAVLYSLLLTLIGSLPFGFYFLAPKDGRG